MLLVKGCPCVLFTAVSSGKPLPEEEELTIHLESHTKCLVNLLVHDLANHQHITETIDNKLSLTIQNTADNDMFIPEAVKQPDLMKNDEWLSLKFNNNSYYLDYKEIQDNDDTLYYLAANKKTKYIIFAKGPSSKFKTTTIHHLYIRQDDGLGRYKIQTNEGVITTQFFVPVDYVADRYDRFRKFMDDFKKVQNNLLSDAYYSQIIWYKLQVDAIHIINYDLNELEKDLKVQIDKSLDHIAVPVPMPDVNNFDDFYDKVVDREKKMRLQLDLQTYPNTLVVFNKLRNTTSVILVQKLERDVFTMDEKIRILVSNYDPDYYVMVGEAWMPKSDKIQQRVSKKYQYGDITKLSSHDRTEILIFYGKTKNSINKAPDKSELYEIIRERQNDEKSRILELRKLKIVTLNMEMQFPGFN